MKRRWLFVMLLVSGVAALVVVLTMSGDAPDNTTQPTAKNGGEDETDRRINALIAELHGLFDRPSVVAKVQTPRFWEVVRALEQHQARLGMRRSPVVERLSDFFRYLPEDQRYDADRKKLFAAMVVIDPQSPDRLVEKWLWEESKLRGRLRSLGPAIVPALVRALQNCKADDESRRNAVAGVLREMTAEEMAQVDPAVRRAAEEALAKVPR
jgi:hypothetical protein